jgi:opacity protein-like surface antigen
MRSVLKATACLVIVSGIIFSIHAQNNIPKFQFGLGLGVFVYQGDLTPSALGSYRTLRPVINLFASKLFSPSFAIRGNLAFGGLRGDDAKYSTPEYRQQRNLNFSSPVAEVSGIAEWNVLGRNYQSRRLSPYLFAGVGASVLHIGRDASRLNLEYFSSESEVMTGLVTDMQRPTPRVLAVLPVGAGVRYFFSDKIGIGAETSYRLASTDYLDGFSQAANPTLNDHYYSHTVSVIYRPGKKNTLACPTVKY